MIQVIKGISEIMKRVTDHHLSAFAGQATFFILLSFFPLIMSLLGIVNFLPITTDDVMKVVMLIIPDVFSEYIQPLVDQTISKSTTSLFSITVLVTLWASGKGIMIVKNAFNASAEVQNYTNYILARIIAVINTIIFAAVLLMMTILLVFGNKLLHMLMDSQSIWSDLAVYFGTFRVIVTILILFLFFSFFYCILPDEKRSLTQSAPGAILTTFSWILISLAFSIYIDNFSNFSVMYGSLTGIILTLLWLYFSMYTMFVGAEINYYISDSKKRGNVYIPGVVKYQNKNNSSNTSENNVSTEEKNNSTTAQK